MGETRWLLVFYCDNRGSNQEPDFPEYEFWHSNKEKCIAAGQRGLQELAERGDRREWVVCGFPDPVEVGAGRHPRDLCVLSLSDYLPHN